MEQKTTGGTSVTDPADVGTLIICRGAKIVANGTAESPIIFTNIDDPFVPGGEITIPNKDNGVTSNASYAPYDTVTSANNSYTKRDYTGNKRFEYDSTCGGVIILGKTPVAFGNPGASGNIAIAVGNVGSGYESAPAVTFSPTGAAASAVLDGVGRVNRVAFTQRGLFDIESSGAVSFTPSAASAPTTLATGTYTMRPVTGRVTGFTVSNGGSGYGTTAPAVTVSGTDKATATAVLTSGAVSSIAVVYHGSGYSAATPPTVTIAAPSSGVTATANAVVTEYTGKFELSNVTMTQQGANYTSATAVFVGLPAASPAPVFTAPIGKSVVQYVITNPGGSYGSAPTVTVAAPPTNAGSVVAATATASIAGAFTNPSASPLTSGVGANFIEGFQTIDGALLGSAVNYSGSIYGGSDDNDNSGTLRFVSIRYGGFILSPNNEINGLTTGAVGRGTLFEFIEVVNNADDEIEHFGGTVDMKYVAGLFGGDDGIDIDQGYRGRIQFGFQIQNNTGFGRPTANIGDCLGEWDGGESPTTSRPYTVHTLFNFTGIGTGSGASAGKGINYKENSGGKVFNSIFADARTGIALESGSSTATSATDGTTAGHRFAFTRTDGGVYNILGATGGAGEPDASLQYTTFMKIGTQTALNSSVLSGINTTAGQYGAALIADKNNSYASTTGDIRSIARVSTTGQLDPRLTEASTIRNNGIRADASGGVRAADTFYSQTQLRGAFRDCNWLSGWSLASEWGLFSDANVAIPAVKLTRASGVLTVSFTPTSGVEYVIETSPDGKKFTPFKTVTGGSSDVSEALGAGTANSVLFVRCMPL
jgi:hypothetical protein